MTKVKRSKMARRQMRLQVEEEQWMEEMLKKCSEQLHLSDEAVPLAIATQSLGDAVKTAPMIAVNEVPAGE